MVSRQFQITVDRLNSEWPFPMALPDLPSVKLSPNVDESKRDREFARLRFLNWPDANGETFLFLEAKIVILMYIEKVVVTPGRQLRSK
jgi:hypothetical protein